ncbi:kinase-like protein, partial [Gloeophyllum trabeum ATCC 11539]
KFAYTAIGWKENGRYYLLNHPQRFPGVNKPIDQDVLEAFEKPEPVPFNHIWGKWHAGLTDAPSPLPGDVYVKSPTFVEWNGTDFIGKAFLMEAELWEHFKKLPHPNICTYYGCVRDSTGTLVSGLCFKKYRYTLYEANRNVIDGFNKDSAIRDIRSGLEHIHSLGYVHNDLNPANIMFDDDHVAVIIDFGSCAREGEDMGYSGGTFGWSNNARVSKRENDFYGLRLIERWLAG